MMSELTHELDTLERDKKQQMRLILGLDDVSGSSDTSEAVPASSALYDRHISVGLLESTQNLDLVVPAPQSCKEPIALPIEAGPTSKEEVKLSSASGFKKDVINSMKYRVQNRIPTQMQKSVLPDYLNEAIEQMYTEQKTDRQGVLSDPFFILKKNLKDRTLAQ